MLTHLDTPRIREDIHVAVRTTLEHGFGSNHSLCHGDLGNLEFIFQAGRLLDCPEYQASAEHMCAVILESIREGGWMCGVPLSAETPGIMTGLAGIGFELLRLAHPQRVPSVLSLSPPLVNCDIPTQ